jgi:hypothetical protein
MISIMGARMSLFVGSATAGERWLQLPSRRSPRRVVPPAFSALGHDLKRPRLEVVKDLLQPRDGYVLYGASVAGHNRSSSADTYKSARLRKRKPFRAVERMNGMRTRALILLAAAAPFLLAGCGKGKY